jgi:hypothetical protein
MKEKAILRNKNLQRLEKGDKVRLNFFKKAKGSRDLKWLLALRPGYSGAIHGKDISGHFDAFGDDISRHFDDFDDHESLHILYI